MNTDQRWMALALEEAAKARGRTSPNPLVGAVIVKQGRLLATGFHQKAGQPHAEREALSAMSEDPAGATVYVNLEPCSHTGRTPPCVDALIEARVARVVVGIQDPDPRVNGRGLRRLREAGIDVTVGVLAEECRALNLPFITRVEKQRPFVSMKVATSLDSRIATRSGDSKWLSSKPALTWAHEMRDWVDAVLVGAGTVEADDPALTVRLVEGQNPMRLVLDSMLRSSLERRLFQDEHATHTVVFCTQPDQKKQAVLEARGVTVVQCPSAAFGGVDVDAVMQWLHQRNVMHVLVEGGGGIHGTFLRAQCVDRLYVVMTPWLLGDDGVSAFRFTGEERLADSLHLQTLNATSLGPDVLIEAVPQWSSATKESR